MTVKGTIYSNLSGYSCHTNRGKRVLRFLVSILLFISCDKKVTILEKLVENTLVSFFV